jgi:hypothetical protein
MHGCRCQFRGRTGTQSAKEAVGWHSRASAATARIGGRKAEALRYFNFEHSEEQRAEHDRPLQELPA